MRLVERAKEVVMDIGSSVSSFATTTKSVNMKLYNRCKITLHLLQAGAGTATVTLKQGTTSTTATALAFAGYFKNEAGVGTDALTEVVATTLTTAGAFTGYNKYVFEVKSDQLNTDTIGSENTWLRMNVAGVSSNTCAMIVYELYEARVNKGGGGMPTAMA